MRWDDIALGIKSWAAGAGVSLRDAIVLVPFTQLLPPCRRAFARAGGWMPRIETTRTLAATLGPPPDSQAGQIIFDDTIDALAALNLLRSQSWGIAWSRRDPKGFDHAAAALLASARELVSAAASRLPTQRPAYWESARRLLPDATGPGASERLLARVAIEWASMAAPLATDRLFGLEPAAWISIEAAGADPLTMRLMSHASVPCFVIDTDIHEGDDLATTPPSLALCDGFEEEAQCAAAQVLEHVRRHEWPVALIAEDRILIRRVRALLERHALRQLDETGWKLSTTRAAALVMSLLQSARADATTDTLFDWLKSSAADVAATEQLEGICRRAPFARIADLRQVPLEPGAARLWAHTANVLAAFDGPRRRSLSAWLDALRLALQMSDATTSLQEDDAGRQVTAALRLDASASHRGVWEANAAQVSMTLAEFRDWVDGVLEKSVFRPAPVPDQPAQVVITPLAGAMLRPFAAVVFPGSDDRHLGASAPSVALFSDAQCDALGLPTAQSNRTREWLAFCQVLKLPRLTLLRRRVDAGRPLAASPFVERMAMALESRGVLVPPWTDPRVPVALSATPVRMTAPAAPELVPTGLSASAYEALRACPYRYFALNMLKLREDEELEREVEKRDYGDWLHKLLLDFHRARDKPADRASEVATLLAMARASQTEQDISDADFLPFAASFETLAPRYITWLHQRDAEGARWLAGEEAITLQGEASGGLELRGVIDRIDEYPTGAGSAIDLIDYKTGAAKGLQEKVARPLEDTQLAFYAALMGSRTLSPLTARYLALDGSKGIDPVEHKGVETSAAALLEGIADDFRRLRSGAGMPALGEGSACDYCAARGVCRRDHWTDTDSVLPA